MSTEFDYGKLADQVILPEQQLNFTGADFMNIYGVLRAFIDNNTILMYGNDGKVAGAGIDPKLEPVSELLRTMYREHIRRFYEDGNTLSIEEYEKLVQKRAMEASLAKSDTNTQPTEDSGLESLEIPLEADEVDLPVGNDN